MEPFIYVKYDFGLLIINQIHQYFLLGNPWTFQRILRHPGLEIYKEIKHFKNITKMLNGECWKNKVFLDFKIHKPVSYKKSQQL